MKRTRHEDAIFVSHPSLVARALVFWAFKEYGHSRHNIEMQEDGVMKVDIPGVTRIAFAPEID